MSVRIGIAIAADRVRAVGVRNGRPVWALEASIDEETGLAAALRTLLVSLPRPRGRRPRVNVVVGAGASQVKLLRNLPPLESAAELARLVQEGASRFFLRNGAPLVTSGIRVLQPGEVWAAAIDQHTVRDIEAACEAERMRLDAVVPVAVALAHVLTSEETVWRDGDLRLEVRQQNGTLTGVRRYRACGPAAIEPAAGVEALAPLGEDSWRYADAYGAAMLPRGEPLVVRPGGGAGGPVVPLRRLAAAFGVLTITVLASQVLPVLAAKHAAERAAERTAAIGAEWQAALEAEAELARVTAALAEITAFESDRRSATLLLADLARTLPEGSALLTIRADTAGGTLVALAPRVAIVIDSLERVPSIAAPEIAGPVTREGVGGRELERATLRFRLYQPPGGSPSADTNPRDR